MVREDIETIIRQKLLEREWAACKPPRYAADPANQVNSHSPI